MKESKVPYKVLLLVSLPLYGKETLKFVALFLLSFVLPMCSNVIWSKDLQSQFQNLFKPKFETKTYLNVFIPIGMFIFSPLGWQVWSKKIKIICLR